MGFMVGFLIVWGMEVQGFEREADGPSIAFRL